MSLLTAAVKTFALS